MDREQGSEGKREAKEKEKRGPRIVMDEMTLVHIIIALSNLLPGALIKIFGRTNPETGKTGWATYNTPKAQLSKETQAFANHYAGSGFVWMGLALLALQLVVYFLVKGDNSIYIIVGAMTLAYIPVIVLTERALDKRFDNEGKPRNDYSEF